jgi:hypothetical protein
MWVDSLPGYDAWLTNELEEEWGRCPNCGCTQEDASLWGETYVCPECGRKYFDHEARPDPSLAREDAILDRAGL